MLPETYGLLRRSLGPRREAARLLGCHETTVRLREAGHVPVTTEAAERIVAAVYDAALAEGRARAARRERRLARAEATALTPAELRGCFRALGWRRRADAARALLGDAGDVETVTRWTRGAARVPDWVARDLRTLLGLGPNDPWPRGSRPVRTVLPDWESV